MTPAARAAGGWANPANRFTASFPADLGDGEVRVADRAAPERSVGLALRPEPAAAPGEGTGADPGVRRGEPAGHRDPHRPDRRRVRLRRERQPDVGEVPPGRTTTDNDRDQATSTTPTCGSAITSTYAGTGNADRLTAGGTSFQSTPLAPAPGRSATGRTSTWTVRDDQGALLAIRQGPTATPGSATSYYSFTDRVDFVRAMVTSSGFVSATYACTTYGATKATTGTLVQPYQYGAGHTDTLTRLIKLGIRYDDPTHGRFTQPDPTSHDANQHLYVGADPISFTDPTGAGARSEVLSLALRAEDRQIRGGTGRFTRLADDILDPQAAAVIRSSNRQVADALDRVADIPDLYSARARQIYRLLEPSLGAGTANVIASAAEGALFITL